MKEWEYKVITFPPNLSGLALQTNLSETGREGWELACTLGLMFIFKRERRMIQ